MDERKPGTFAKGDTRINRKGRPKHLDAFRRLAADMAGQPAVDADGNPVLDAFGNPLTFAQAILLGWATSTSPDVQRLFIEYAFGKVPVVNEVTGKDGGPVTFRVVYERKRDPNDATA